MTGGAGYVDPKAIELCRTELGLDRSYAIQFLDFIWGFVRFDFGTSMWTGRPIVEEVGLRFELSLQIAIMATLTAIILAIPLGTISAVKQNTWIDYLVRGFSIAGIAMPSFWLGILIILGLLITSKAVFGSPWMPPIKYVPLWEDPLYNLSMTIFPALATGYRYSAVATRMTRSALLEVLREDYVRTARAKGLVEFAFLMGGLVVTEQVFNLNGLGKLFVASVTQHDYAMTQALVMLVVTIFIVTNFIVDIIYAWLDPRIRYK
jgi:peptide/nickel transport system permease protein